MLSPFQDMDTLGRQHVGEMLFAFPDTEGGACRYGRKSVRLRPGRRTLGTPGPCLVPYYQPLTGFPIAGPAHGAIAP